MKRTLMGVAILFLAAAGSVSAQERPLKLLISPRSTIPAGEVLRHLSSHCPNVSITLDAKKSDYMLEAGGWSGNYHFIVFGKGGDALYSTSTSRLGNAAKDVCKFVNSQKPK